MKYVTLPQAKLQLSKLAERVKRTGKPIALTKWGQPYVDLIPHHETPPQRRSQSEVLNDLDALRRKLPKSSSKTIEADLAEGRR